MYILLSFCISIKSSCSLSNCSNCSNSFMIWGYLVLYFSKNKDQWSYKGYFFPVFISSYENVEFTFINSILRDVEQKWRMNLERMKYYEWREKLSDYKIEMDVDSDDETK